MDGSAFRHFGRDLIIIALVIAGAALSLGFFAGSACSTSKVEFHAPITVHKK